MDKLRSMLPEEGRALQSSSRRRSSEASASSRKGCVLPSPGLASTSLARTSQGSSETGIHFIVKRQDEGDWGDWGERTPINPMQTRYYQSQTFCDSSRFKFQFQ